MGTLWSRVSSLVIKNGLPTDISPSLSLSTTNRIKQDTAILPFSKEMTNQFHIQILDYMSYDPRNQKKQIPRSIQNTIQLNLPTFDATFTGKPELTSEDHQKCEMEGPNNNQEMN